MYFSWFKTHFKLTFFILLGFISGFFIHSLFIMIYKYQSQDFEKNTAIREKTNSTLISPLLLCSETKNSFEITTLSTDISSYIQNTIDHTTVENISFYYRDLHSGKWTGVNEDDLYTPASLLKVPIMIAFYKEAEKNPSILSKKIFNTQIINRNDRESIQPEKSIQKNKIYTVSELISYMIEYSDNNATFLLTNELKNESITKVFIDLSLPDPINLSGSVDYLSTRLYAHFLRTLYNATYLNQEYSIKALELLTAPDFPDGISGSIPKNNKIANKFGERTVLTDDGNIKKRELHDCGIVYTKNPYIICIMTKGTDFSALKTAIRTISKKTYDFNTRN